MLSPFRANYLVAYARRLPFDCTRTFTSTSDENKRKFSQFSKPAEVSTKSASDHLPSSLVAHHDSFDEGDSLTAALSHYSSLPPLPPIDKWLSRFPYGAPVVRDRISIRSPESAIRVAQSFINSKKTTTGNPKVVIEAFPGPGALSRALLTLPPSQLKKLIILEDYEPYLEYLRPLARADPRVRVVPLSGFTWDTYSHLSENGDLDVDIAPWKDLHPELHFVTHIPQTVPGEQLVAQLFRCIPDNSWLFRYGRVPMSFLLADWVWRRTSSPPQGAERCKLSVIAEASAHSFLSLPPGQLSPYVDHFHPSTNSRIGPGHTLRPDSRRRGSPFLAVNIVPHDQQVIDKGMLDQWDYVLRRLFVLKSTPLRKAMSSLAPGAEVLLDKLTDKKLPPEQRVDIRLRVNHLTLSDWALIVRAFDAWPFAPRFEH